MKKVKFLLPVAAIVFAVAGVFATGNNSAPTFAIVDVTANTTSCVKDGTCDNSISGNCQLNSGTQFYVKSLTCTAASSGKFAL